MSVEPGHILIVGASGVIGSAAIEHFARLAGWSVTALSRRPPVVDPDCRFRHVAVDLENGPACCDALSALPLVTHMIYAAVREAPGLAEGWRDPDLIAANGRMFANALDPVVKSGGLRHLSLLQGAKAYGAHRHAVEIPLREDAPRDEHANFYWLHEDHARSRSVEAGFGLTIFRPQVLLGGAAGAAMNPVAAIGAYAALCREMGEPFVYPAESAALFEAVDAGLMAEAFAWAISTPEAEGETFNIANGDALVLRHAWPRLAERLGLGSEGTAPTGLVAFFARDECQDAWMRLATRHRLRISSLESLLGQSHHYCDMLLGARAAQRPLPVLLSTIKIRHAGFAACRDSEASLLYWLRRMAELNLLPTFQTQESSR